MSNIHNSKIGNQNPDAIMYQGADTPSEQQVAQGVKKLNPWKQECWHAEYIDSTNNKHVVWHKYKTLDNCYIKYGIAKKVPKTSIYPFNDLDNVYNISSSVIKKDLISTDIPVIKELEDKNPTILISHYAENAKKNIPKLIFADRNYPDNEYTQKLFQSIREYFRTTPLTNDASVNSLFGKADTFGAHWHMGDVQQLYGARDNWRLLVGDGNKITTKDYTTTGVELSQTFANTGIDDITFVFNKNAVTILDSTFSALKPSMWGTWDLKVEYANTEKPYPYYEADEMNPVYNVKDFQGFIPTSMIKTFRASKISQEGLNNFFKNSILNYCKDLNGCFAEKLRCQHDTVPAAYGCQPYEESFNNIITVGQHQFWRATPWLCKSTKGTIYFYDAGTKEASNVNADSQGSLLETFMDSSIKYFHPVIDCTLMFMSWHWDKTFATYRMSEGVHPMVDIRLKNLGNCAEYRFDSNGNWDGKNNTKYFSEESVKYLVNNCLDLSKYSPEILADGTLVFKNKVIRRNSKIYGPEEWRSKLSQEDLQGARRKNISIYINNELVN